MSYREVLVARHGETYWNREKKWQGSSDISLNEVGIQQARELGEILSQENIAGIYSSDLIRAETTAKIISEITGAGPVVTDQRIRERNLGKFEGWHSEDVARYLGIPPMQKHILENDELSIEGGPDVEHWTDFLERVWDFMEDVASSGVEKTLIVAHGGVMRAIMYPLANDGFKMPIYKNCEIIRLVTDGNEWKIV